MTGVGSHQCDRNESAPYRLIQIGIAVPDTKGVHPGYSRYTSDIGWPKDSYPWEQAALDVNGFDHERIQKGYSASYVDNELYDWLTNIMETDEYNSLIPVGWNVGGFDMPYVRRYLPKTANLFGYRAKDLNSTCYDLAKVFGNGTVNSSNKYKKASKKYAEAKLREIHGADKVKWHDAGFDSEAAMYSWEWMIEKFKSGNKSL